MNLDDAVQTIVKKGFTERQARFLVLVARHSGVCVMRQFSAFAGIVFGQKTRKFFARLEGPWMGLDIRLRAQPRAHLPPPTSGRVRSDRRAREPASPTARRTTRARAPDDSGHHSRTPRYRLARDA